MFKRILKWLGAIASVFVIAIAIFLINLIWFRPWSLNLFYEKVFAEFSLISRKTFRDRTGGAVRHHWSQWQTDDDRRRINRAVRSLEKDLAQLREYPLKRQTDSQRLSTQVLDWFVQARSKAKSIGGTTIR